MNLVRSSRSLNPWFRAKAKSAIAAEKSGQWLEATRLYSELSALRRKDPWIWLKLGTVASNAGQAAVAEDAFSQVGRLVPHDAMPHRKLADLLLKQNRQNEAVTSYLRALSADPTANDVREILSQLGLENGALNQRCVLAAIENGPLTPLEKMVLKPNALERIVSIAYLELARHAMNKRNWSVAARYYRTFLSFDPANIAARVQFGHALKESGDVAASEAAYRTAISFQPFYADAYLHLGHVSKLQGKRAETEFSYLTAWRLHPGNRDIAAELSAQGWNESRRAAILQLNWCEIADTSSPEIRTTDRSGSHLGLDGPHHRIASGLSDRAYRYWVELVEKASILRS